MQLTAISKASKRLHSNSRTLDKMTLSSLFASFIESAALPHRRRPTRPRTCALSRRALEMQQGGAARNALPADRASSSTEDTFAIDAGRDLFFTGMDEKLAISVLEAPFGSLGAPDDRFIAAERLKFFPSEQSARAIMKFVKSFENAPPNLAVEEVVSRRKAVESLGRHAGAHLREEVLTFFEQCLDDADGYMVETAVWGISQLGKVPESTLNCIARVLERDDVSRRVVIHALTTANYKAAASRIQTFIDAEDAATASAARAALAVLTADATGMEDVAKLLQNDQLNVRRAAIEDLTRARYHAALGRVARAPLSLVLRTRAVRNMLQEQVEMNDLRVVDRMIWDHAADIDTLGRVKEGRRARDTQRNINALFKNDALEAYLGTKTLCEEASKENGRSSQHIGEHVLKSYTERSYFDYFGAYHVFKTLGWLQYNDAYSTLEEAVKILPPRFFNHRVAAIVALGELEDGRAVPVLNDVANSDAIWEVKYACLIAADRLGDDTVRQTLSDDSDWLVRSRAQYSERFHGLVGTGFDVQH